LALDEQDGRPLLRELRSTERQIKLRSREHIVARIRPYQTAEHKIDGVVAAFVRSMGG
jgi:hypothetical protein